MEKNEIVGRGKTLIKKMDYRGIHFWCSHCAEARHLGSDCSIILDFFRISLRTFLAFRISNKGVPKKKDLVEVEPLSCLISYWK